RTARRRDPARGRVEPGAHRRARPARRALAQRQEDRRVRALDRRLEAAGAGLQVEGPSRLRPEEDRAHRASGPRPLGRLPQPEGRAPDAVNWTAASAGLVFLLGAAEARPEEHELQRRFTSELELHTESLEVTGTEEGRTVEQQAPRYTREEALELEADDTPA